MASGNFISIICLGGSRTIVKAIHENVQTHGYSIVGGILELDPFSPAELILTLKVLEPRPKSTKDVGIGSETIIKITSNAFDEVDKHGVPGWVLQQLRDYFEK